MGRHIQGNKGILNEKSQGTLGDHCQMISYSVHTLAAICAPQVLRDERVKTMLVFQCSVASSICCDYWNSIVDADFMGPSVDEIES